MRFYFLPSSPAFSLVKYFAVFFLSFIPFALRGLYLKMTRIFIIIHHLHLYSLLVVLKFNLFTRVISLLDIVVVDLVSSLLNRFICTYSF